MEYINKYGAKLERAIESYPCVDAKLKDLEKKTNVKKIYIVYGEPV